MDTKFILDFITLQFNGINNPNSSQCGEKLLMISSYILEQIKNEPVVFTNTLDERSLKTAFKYCSKISKILNGFAEAYSAPIKEKSQQTLKTIADNEEKLNSVQSECEKCETGEKRISKQKSDLESSNKALLEARSILEARQIEFDSLSAEIESLHKIKTDITDEKISNLRSEIEELAPQVKNRQTQYEELLNRHTELKETNSDLITRIITEIKNADEKLNGEVKNKTLELEALSKSIESQSQKSAELTAAIQKANEQCTEMQALVEANDKIAKAIQDSGYVVDDKTDPKSFYHRVEELDKQAKELGTEYDSLLKNVLSEANDLLDKISKRQEP